jgi:hypothetical protein
LDGSSRLNRIASRIKVDRCQEGMHKGAESPPAWPLEVAALQYFDINAGLRKCAMSFERVVGTLGRFPTNE